MAKVFLIDDDPLVRDTLRLALESAGHDVTVAGDGSNIESELERVAPDVIVTDILMPHTDGLETIRRARKTNADIRLIAMSGGGRTRNLDLLSYAKTFGADATLAKPFVPRRLIDLIARLIAGSSQ